jgi:hypothetical protein
LLEPGIYVSGCGEGLLLHAREDACAMPSRDLISVALAGAAIAVRSLDLVCMPAMSRHWVGRAGVPCIFECWTLEGLTTGTPDEPRPDAVDLAMGVWVKLTLRAAIQPS